MNLSGYMVRDVSTFLSKTCSFLEKGTPAQVFSYEFWRNFKDKKEIPTQLFSCEICKIFKNTYFEEHPQTAASVNAKSDLVDMQ